MKGVTGAGGWIGGTGRGYIHDWLNKYCHEVLEKGLGEKATLKGGAEERRCGWSGIGAALGDLNVLDVLHNFRDRGV